MLEFSSSDSDQLSHTESENDDEGAEFALDSGIVSGKVKASTKEAVTVVRIAFQHRKLIKFFCSPIGGSMAKADSKVARNRFLNYLESVHGFTASATSTVPAIAAEKGTDWQIYMVWLLEHGVYRTHVYTEEVLVKRKGLKPSTVLNYLNDINRVYIWYQLWNTGMCVSYQYPNIHFTIVVTSK